MRILLISDYATATGGAELMTLALQEGLRKRGHDARLLASSARPQGLPSQADYKAFGITSKLRGLIQVANPLAFRRLKQVLYEFRPDVVHVRLFLSQLSPLILPLLRDIPSIYHVAWYRCVCPVGTKMLPDGASCHEPAGLACLRHGCVPLWAWPPLIAQMKLWRHWRDVFDLVVANSQRVTAVTANGSIASRNTSELAINRPENRRPTEELCIGYRCWRRYSLRSEEQIGY